MAAKTWKTWRMKMRVRVNDREDEFVMIEITATNSWDAEAEAVRRIKRDHPTAYAVYSVSKKRVQASS
jgi:hypothetical protein